MFKVIIKNKITNEIIESQKNTGKEAQDFLFSVVGQPNDFGKHDENYEFEVSEILSIDQLNEEIKYKRRMEYPRIDEVVESLIELLIEGRPEKSNEIQAARIAIKNKYPKVV